jgi:hypothetical protein
MNKALERDKEKILDLVTGQILIDEGFRRKAYWDRTHYSIGYGTPAKSKNQEIAEPEARSEAIKCVQDAFDSFETEYASFYPEIGVARAACLVNLIYNLGRTGLKAFKRFNRFLSLGQYEAAAYELWESKWYIDVGGHAGYNPKNRGQRIVRSIATGV